MLCIFIRAGSIYIISRYIADINIIDNQPVNPCIALKYTTIIIHYNTRRTFRERKPLPTQYHFFLLWSQGDSTIFCGALPYIWQY